METKNVKVLVVDDSDIIRHALKSFFEVYNFDVLTCNDGLEGVQRATEFKPDIIFLDLMMPNFDGLKMLQVIKVLDNLKDIPVIVISANTDKRNVLAAIEAGAKKVISKPLQKDMLIKAVNETLGSFTLSKSKKKMSFEQAEKSEIQRSLINFFLETYPDKKAKIVTAFQMKNKELLRMIIHEMRGNGGMMGYPQITEIAGEIEDQILSGVFEWSFLNMKCEQLFSVINEIEKINMEQD